MQRSRIAARTVLAACLCFALMPWQAAAAPTLAQQQRARAKAGAPSPAALKHRESPFSHRVEAESDAPSKEEAFSVSDTGRYVVTVKSGKAASVKKRLAAAGADVVKTSDDGEMIVVETSGSVAAGAASLESEVLDSADVEYIEPDIKMIASYVPSDSQYATEQWGLPKIGAPTAWDITKGSSAIVVAVLDTGLDLDHPEFTGRVDTTNDLDVVNSDSTAEDDNGHGTAVAGVALAAQDNYFVTGMAPGCTVLPVKVLDNTGVGNASDIAEGIDHAVTAGASIINMSFSSESVDTEPQFLRDAVDDALDAGVLLVSPAGNTGATFGDTPVRYPAALPGVIAVASTGNFGDESDEVSAFSSWGPPPATTASGPVKGVDIAAPGDDIATVQWGSAGGGWESRTGTSMAAPFVSGTLALMMSRYSVLPDAYATQLLYGALPIDQDLDGRVDYPSGDPWDEGALDMGFGRLDAATAVSRVPETNDEPSLITALTIPDGSSVSGQIERGDAWDFYKMDLTGGRGFSATLTHTNSVANDPDFDLYLFRDGDEDGAIDFWRDVEVASAISFDSPDTMATVVPASGTYFLGVYRAAGNGNYALKLDERKRTPVSYLSKPRPREKTKSTGYPWRLIDVTKTALKRYKAYQYVGYIRPYHTAGRRDTVYVNLKRWNGSRWVHVKNFWAFNYKRYSFIEYQASIPLPKGRFKLTPVAVEDTQHTRTVGTPNYVTVK